jgi:hypothetical protein
MRLLPLLWNKRLTSPKVKFGRRLQIKEMVQWYFENIDSFLPKEGFKTQFVVESGDRTFTHQWYVTDVDAEQNITYDWKYAEYPGDAFVSWELIDKGAQTNLRLTCVGIENFPSEIPEFTRESCHAGWKYFIQEHLKEYLNRKALA